MRSILPAALSTAVVRVVDPPGPTTGLRSGSRKPTVDSGPAATVELSSEALRARDEQRARDAELLELQGRLPGAQREALDERRELREAREADSGVELSEDDEALLKEMRKADREVRAHEASHIAASGGLASQATFQTVTGPDGRQYAVAGRVKIDTSDAGSPEANEAKMRQVIAAATAVGDPSAADIRVAGRAQRRLEKARRQRAAERYEAIEQSR